MLTNVLQYRSTVQEIPTGLKALGMTPLSIAEYVKR